MSFTRNSGTDGVDDTDTESPTLKAVLQSKNGVGCLTTLADKDTDVVTEDWCLAIQEVRGQFDTDRNLCQFFENSARRQSRVVACTAGTEHDAAATTNNVEVCAKTAERDFVIVKVDTSTHGIHDGLRLLVNFFLHKVIELALHDRCNFYLQSLDATCCGGIDLAVISAEAMDMKLTISNMRNVIILEVEYTLGVLHNGSCIRSDEEFNGLWCTILGNEVTRLPARDLGAYRRRCETRGGRNGWLDCGTREYGPER